MRTLLLAATAGVVGVAFPASASIPVTGDPVLYWNDVLLDAVRTAGTPPPIAARAMAMMNVAVHDAVNAASGYKSESYLTAPRNAGSSPRAAAAMAAHNVLVSLFPTQVATFDAALSDSLAIAPDARSEAAGRACATAVMKDRAADGWNAVVSYTASGLPGRWAPTPPGFQSLPALPQWPDVSPWVMDLGADVRPPPPPALGSTEYLDAYEEVKALGELESALRTPDQTEIALYWADGAGTSTPPGHWLSIATDVSQAKTLSTLENAQLFALLSVAMADAGIASWDAKYDYDFWRPVTGIRLADFDGNDATIADPTWTPLINTPPFPSYVSGHSTFSAAAGSVLALTFGDDYAFCSAQEGVSDPISRCWTSFSEAVHEAGRSRVYGGIHWGFDDVWGEDMGRRIGERAFENLFLDVPEPGLTGLLGLGVCLMLAARRRQTLKRKCMTSPSLTT
jgi:hypothetical protein